VGQDLPEYDDLYQAIMGSQATIVLLQEVTQEFRDLYEQRLAEVYPFSFSGPTERQRGQNIGMLTLSKYEILDSHNFKLANDGLVFQQKSTVLLGEQQIVVFNIHTTFPWIRVQPDRLLGMIPLPYYDSEVRSREIAELLSILKSEENPVILAGDFNMSDRAEEYRQLQGFGLKDAFSEVGVGKGFTWPSNRTPSVNLWIRIPFVRVDYVFHSEDFCAHSARVHRKTGSDHRPLSADLTTINRASISSCGNPTMSH
jgi:endonuclease/exonuclease/phosphatase (EEP) superfamily protein YafD